MKARKWMIGTSLLLASWMTAQAAGPLRVHSSNPRYFTDDSGRAIYLAGSHVWQNMRDFGPSDPPPLFDYDAYLDFLQSRGHNFFRLWAWDLPHSRVQNTSRYANIFPWPRSGPGVASDGKPRFDLSSFDQNYFDRLRQRVMAARDRGIYVSIMLFEGYAIQFFRNGADGLPFDANNNVNGISAPGTSSNTMQNPAVTDSQDAYVRKVIDTVNDLDNVLYEVCNEAGSYSTSWQTHMISLVKSYETTKPKRHPVGMTFQHSGGSNSTLFNSAADWISPGRDGGYMDNPPIPDGSKVVISDTDHLWGEGGDGVWVWKSFMRGLNTLFMDGGIELFPPSTISWQVSARNAMSHTRMYAMKVDLGTALPQDSSSACSTRYCLVDPGRQYLVYQPDSGSFSVSLVAGTYSFEWFNPGSGTVSSSGTVTVPAGSSSFTPPFAGSAVLFLAIGGAAR